MRARGDECVKSFTPSIGHASSVKCREDRFPSHLDCHPPISLQFQTAVMWPHSPESRMCQVVLWKSKLLIGFLTNLRPSQAIPAKRKNRCYEAAITLHFTLK